MLEALNLGPRAHADLSRQCSTSQCTHLPHDCCLTKQRPPLQLITWNGGRSLG
jgi:hypothetical protein